MCSHLIREEVSWVMGRGSTSVGTRESRTAGVPPKACSVDHLTTTLMVDDRTQSPLFFHSKLMTSSCYALVSGTNSLFSIANPTELFQDAQPM